MASRNGTRRPTQLAYRQVALPWREICAAKFVRSEQTLNDPLFLRAAEAAKLGAFGGLGRQARKWNNRKGLAWKQRLQAAA
jgi:hypothetical protein